jgi:hypothetical protein
MLVPLETRPPWKSQLVWIHFLRGWIEKNGTWIENWILGALYWRNNITFAFCQTKSRSLDWIYMEDKF